MDGIASFECVCEAGYTGDLCGVDINECDSVYCGSNGECRNGLANFTCDCHPGFNGTFVRWILVNI